MGLTIRRIRANEGLRLRALRLQALADAPTAFGSTLAVEAAFPESVWHERASGGAVDVDRITFVAEDRGRWVGLATGLAGDYKGAGSTLVGMFVEGDARGQGVGRALVEAVVDWARSRGASQLSLWVTATNEPALALYRRCGFRPTGETEPIAHTPSLTEMRMARDLGPVPNPPV